MREAKRFTGKGLPSSSFLCSYYPFGMDMPGRKFGNENRYGFNGKERDKDMNSLTAYDYGFRIYNPAIGKFLSVDPLTASYPWYTPYQFAGNKPIIAIDLDGLEDKIVITDKFIEDAKKAVLANDEAVKIAIKEGQMVIMRITLATGPNDRDYREVVLSEGSVSSDVGYIDFSSNGVNRQWNFHYEEPTPLKSVSRPSPIESSVRDAGILDVEASSPLIAKQPVISTKKIKSSVTGTEHMIKEKNIPKAGSVKHFIKDLNQKFDARELTYLNHDGRGGLIDERDRKTLSSFTPDVKKFFELPALIKEDGGIKSITISMWIAVSNYRVTMAEAAGQKQSFQNAANEILKLFQSSGVKNIIIETPIVSHTGDYEKENRDKGGIKVKLTR